MHPTTSIEGMNLTTARRSMLLATCELRDRLMSLSPNGIGIMSDETVVQTLRDFKVMEANLEMLEDHIERLEKEEHGEREPEQAVTQESSRDQDRAPIGARVTQELVAPSAAAKGPAVIYTYYGTILRIHDGDTFAVDLDMGCRIWQRNLDVRVHGINAPELATDPGKKALAFAQTLLHVGDVVRLDSVSGKWYEKYGRLLATVRFGPAFDQDFGGLMVSSGNAVTYDALAELDSPRGVL